MAKHKVDYVVIGGLAVVLHGGDTVTQDLDLAFDTEDANFGRLADALQELGAKPKRWNVKNFRLKLTDLSGNWLHLESASGDIDLISTTPGVPYEELRNGRQTFEIDGVPLMVASVEDLLKIKTLAGRPKDLVHVAELKVILKHQL